MPRDRADNRYDSDEAKWQAVLDRDPDAVGRFYVGVKTTGIYCRPSCSSRQPLRKNVTFHPSIEAAERAGFRACKRCRPAGPTPAERDSAEA